MRNRLIVSSHCLYAPYARRRVRTVRHPYARTVTTLPSATVTQITRQIAYQLEARLSWDQEPGPSQAGQAGQR
jgi:hypothetical protein